MYIILKQYEIPEQQEILNVFNCYDLTLIRNWVREYINKDITSYNYIPITKDIKDLTYEINDADKCFQLLKRYKHINRGYIYNSSERITDIVYTIYILEFINDTSTQPLQSIMWNNVNKEINNRVLKHLEKDSILEVFKTIQDKIETKNTWNNTEFTSLLGEIIKSFKVNLYRSISKRIRRIHKRNNIYKIQTEETISNLEKSQDNSNEN